MHGNNIVAVLLRNEPVRATTYPKNGTVKARTTVLITKTVRIRMLMNRSFES